MYCIMYVFVAVCCSGGSQNLCVCLCALMCVLYTGKVFANSKNQFMKANYFLTQGEFAFLWFLFVNIWIRGEKNKMTFLRISCCVIITYTYHRLCVGCAVYGADKHLILHNIIPYLSDGGFIGQSLLICDLMSVYLGIPEPQLHHYIQTRPADILYLRAIRPSNIKMSDHISCSDFISINSLSCVFHH